MWEGKEWVLFRDLLSFPFVALKKNWGEGEARLSKNPKTQCPCRARVCPGSKSCLELRGRGGRRCAVRPQMLRGPVTSAQHFAGHRPGCGGHFLDRASILWLFGGRNYPRDNDPVLPPGRGHPRAACVVIWVSSAPKSTRQPEPAGLGGGATPVPRQVGLHLSCLHRGVFGVGMRKRSAGRAHRLPERPSGSEKGEKDIVCLQPFCRCPAISFLLFSPK